MPKTKSGISTIVFNMPWSNQQNTTSGATVFKGTDGTNLSVNSGMTVYNGNRIRNAVKKSETDYESDKYNTEVIKENVSLNVLNAYLQVKSQLAKEKQTLAAAQSQLTINTITLMQLMEIPEVNDFVIEHPNLDSLINQKRIPDPKDIYQISLIY